MAALRLRSDGRHEVADTVDADRAHGCQADDWCILANGHAGLCNEDREEWPGADVEYVDGSGTVARVHPAHEARHGHPGEPCRDRSVCYPGDGQVA